MIYPTIQKFGVSKILVFLKEIILLFSKDALNWSELTKKKNRFLSSKRPEVSMKYEILSSTTVFNIDNNKNVSRAVNHYIRMISERSFDTEDWKFSFTVTGISYMLKYIN